MQEIENLQKDLDYSNNRIFILLDMFNNPFIYTSCQLAVHVCYHMVLAYQLEKQIEEVKKSPQRRA